MKHLLTCRFQCYNAESGKDLELSDIIVLDNSEVVLNFQEKSLYFIPFKALLEQKEMFIAEKAGGMWIYEFPFQNEHHFQIEHIELFQMEDAI